MLAWKRAVQLGTLSWLIPFIVSFAIFPLKQANAPLFEVALMLVLLITAGALLSQYFRDREVTVREAVLVGALWLAINLALDYPMFAYGPMKMTIAKYYSEIGVAYLMFPAFAFGAARLVSSRPTTSAG